MKTTEQSLSKNTITFWLVVVNLPLIAISIYIHYLLEQVGGTGNTFLNNLGVWFLVAFKLIGANLILATIFSEFKIK
ncbi:MAG: hypothetical protein ABJG47_09700 [Ekhidna sp.]